MYADLRLATDVLMLVASIGAGFFGWVNRAAIKEVHLTMNSRLDELLKSTRATAFAEGRASQVPAAANAAAEILQRAANEAAVVLAEAAKKAE
jgi:hypothetical protein